MPLSFFTNSGNSYGSASELGVLHGRQRAVVEAPVVGWAEGDDVVIPRCSSAASRLDVTPLGSPRFAADATRYARTGDRLGGEAPVIVKRAETFGVGRTLTPLLGADGCRPPLRQAEDLSGAVLPVVGRTASPCLRDSLAPLDHTREFLSDRLELLSAKGLLVVTSTEVPCADRAPTIANDASQENDDLVPFGSETAMFLHLEAMPVTVRTTTTGQLGTTVGGA